MTLEEALINLNNATYRALRLAMKAKAGGAQIERLQALARLSDEAVDAPHLVRPVTNNNEQRKDQVA